MFAAFLRSLFASIILSGAGIVSSYLLNSAPPPELLADQATRLLPPRVFALILDALQYWGKPLLLLALSLFWLVLGTALAFAVDLAIRSRAGGSRASSPFRLCLAAGLLVVAIGLIAIPVLAGNGFFGSRLSTGLGSYSITVLLSALAFTIALYYVEKPVGVGAATGAEGAIAVERPIGRREFLSFMAAGGLALASTYLLSRTVVRMLSNARAVAVQLAGFAVPEITPAKDFYVVSKNFSSPVVNAAEWNLEVTGEVENPLRLSLDGVRQLPSVQEYVTLECVSNEVAGGLIGNALWTGVRMNEVLQAAGLKSTVTHVLTTSVDGYTESMPIEAALADDVILAYEMNSESLTADHGFPLRLLFPGHYGMKSTKWLSRLEAATGDRPGYWEKRGWNEEAWVKTMTRIDVPHDRVELPLGAMTLAGIAFSGARGISRVETSTDGGRNWTTADLKPALSQFTWLQWKHDWMPPRPGRYTIAARAFDLNGVPQIADPSDPFPSGATGYHIIVLKVTE